MQISSSIFCHVCVKLFYALCFKESESCLVVYNSLRILHARILEWVAFPFFQGSSQPRDWTQVFCIAGRFLPAEPQGKPKNTRVGSLSLLQRIFWSQESNQGLLHCRQILYQLSYQGSPLCFNTVPIKQHFLSAGSIWQSRDQDPELTFPTNTSKLQFHIEHLMLRITWRLADYNQGYQERTTQCW